MTDSENSTAPARTNERKPVFETVPLIEPIVRGEKTIPSITLRKPRGGELRGLTLSDIIGLDIGTILKLVPRISDPVLTDEECQNLDPGDLTEIGGTIRGFFMTAAERQLLDAMIAEQQPQT